jgi:hypothetical protein
LRAHVIERSWAGAVDVGRALFGEEDEEEASEDAPANPSTGTSS